MIQLPAPAQKYDLQNEAAMRRVLEQEISRLSALVVELQRRLAAAGIP